MMIDIDHVSFQYSGAEQENLQDFNLQIKKGGVCCSHWRIWMWKDLCNQVDKYAYSPLLRRGNVRGGPH